MVNGPPCQRCGWALRWAPEQNAWLCDRCRNVVPAQPAYGAAPQYGQQSQQPYGQQPQMQPHPQQGPVAGQRKSSKGIMIAIAGVVVVAAIIAIVVATRGGGDSDVVAKMSEFKDRVCACKDKACTDAVQADLVAWSQEQAKNPPKPVTVDDATTKKLGEITDGYTKCLTDALIASGGGGGAPTPKVGSGSGAVPTPPPPPAAAFAVGDRVMAKWSNGSWYPGKVSAVRANGTFDIQYDDGDRSSALPASHVRKRTASSSSSTSSSRPAADAPCPGPGITRRCNGVCVNIQEDNNNCGECGYHCPSGKSCDGHMFCRDAEGNL